MTVMSFTLDCIGILRVSQKKKERCIKSCLRGCHLIVEITLKKTLGDELSKWFSNSFINNCYVVAPVIVIFWRSAKNLTKKLIPSLTSCDGLR